MKALKSWTVSDALWEQAAPLIPKPERLQGHRYKRRPGGGRKPIEPRRVFEAIVYVLRTGCQWKALPREYGSASSIHKYFLEWKRCGVFVKMWRRGLAAYDEMEGIAWLWQSVDGSMVKAPLAVEAAGPNPTDRGKKRYQTQSARRRPWNPAVVGRERGPAARRETPGADAGRRGR
jgi:transposase